MISSSLLLKVLGGVSVVTIGTIGTYLLLRNSSDVVSDKALTSTKGWKVTSTPEKADQEKTNVEINVEWKEGNTTWTSKIKGFIEKPEQDNTLEIKEQATTLEKELGIKGDSRDKNIQQNLKKFIENSQKHKTKSTNTSFESVINVEVIKVEGKKYKFKDEELKKLYDGSSEIFKKLNITKTEIGKEQVISESELKSIKFEGKTNFNIKDSPSIKLKIEKIEDATSFPEGFKFTFTSDKEIKITNDDKDSSPIVLNSTASIFKIKINGESYSLEKNS